MLMLKILEEEEGRSSEGREMEQRVQKLSSLACIAICIWLRVADCRVALQNAKKKKGHNKPFSLVQTVFHYLL